MTDTERQEADELLRVLQGRTKASDCKVAGFNVGTNCGDAAGQTIDHAHIHLIPRRKGDMEIHEEESGGRRV
jgi:ATP adenylyltransferase